MTRSPIESSARWPRSPIESSARWPRSPIESSARVAIECEGAPRDLGLDQGRAWRSHLAAEFASEPLAVRLARRLGRASPDAARLARDLRRHFPRQAETVHGLATGAGVPPTWLLQRLARELGPNGTPRETAGIAGGAAGDSGALLARTARGVRLRRTRPEGGFPTIAATPPWLPGALVGVNEAGLAAVVVPLETSDAAARTGACAAPAALLAEDCLQRFGSIAASLDWCLGRPGGGCAALLFAHANGDVAALEVTGDDRRVTRPPGGILAVGAGRGDEADIAKALRDASPLAPERVAALVGRHDPTAPFAVCADPARRRLGILAGTRATGTFFQVSGFREPSARLLEARKT